MEERVSGYIPDLSGYILELKALPLTYSIITEETGIFTILDWEEVYCYGIGRTLDESVSDMLTGYREISEMILQDLKERPVKMGTLRLALKYAVSSEEEIKRCLAGRNYEDF